MSKHLKKKNPPAPSLDDDDDSLNQDLLTPGAADPVTVTAAGAAGAAGQGCRSGAVFASGCGRRLARLARPAKDVGAEPSSPLAVDDGWQRVAEQIDSLLAVLLNLVMLVTSSTVPGRPQETLPRGDERGSRRGVSEGPLVQDSAAMALLEGPSAVTVMAAATWRKAAILGVAAGAQSEPAILPEPRGVRTAGAASPKDSGAGRSHRLPNIKEFVTGGDWSAFNWRFESAFRSVRWMEEALDTLPTLLDDVSLAVFRSIPSEKKKTLKAAFAEMADVYEPPSDAQRKFMHHQQGSNESPLAYRGALLALAMAAYPDATPDVLDPLILARMSRGPSRRCAPLGAVAGTGGTSGRGLDAAQGW
ncbi:unnamed protein product [Lampetra planeri]